MCVSLHVKCPLFLHTFSQNRNMAEKKFVYAPPPERNFTKIRPMTVALIRADRQTDGMGKT